MLIGEMEKGGHVPTLVNAGEVKLMMGGINKSKLDARGLAVLSINHTLPAVWVPPEELQDQRELARMRIFLVRIRTSVRKPHPRYLCQIRNYLRRGKRPFWGTGTESSCGASGRIATRDQGLDERALATS
ncbi:hypothetical protein LM599_06610 [Candidatus Acetothermia bacterium]|nr:hypothetical protein [Candidatus Acetothermia bacterium]